MSSLFSALTVAVSGLTAQSDAIGNISDDLSNAQTTGFKAISTEFQALVTQSNAAVNNPGGVRATPQYQNDAQGNLIQSGTATSLAISGQGFFEVATATDATGTDLYTRQGDFTLDKNGFLVNGSGYFLLGWNAKADGTIDSSTTGPVQVSAALNNPVATSSSTYVANLPSNVTAGSFTSTPSTIQIFDALGNTHDMTFVWDKSATNAWDLNVTISAGASTASSTVDYTTTIPFTFNGSSNVGTISSIVSSSGSNYTVSTNAADKPAEVTFALTFPGASVGNPQNLTVDFGEYDAATGTTQFADSSDQVSVSSFQQNGLAKGAFSSLGIDSSGNVTITYNNGSTRTIAQIPVVQFFGQDQLQRVTGGAYQATLASGSPRLSAPGADGAGTLVGGSLESSNVDIATEFTDMIQAQQVYSANAKTVTTIDSMLNTIINTIQ